MKPAQRSEQLNEIYVEQALDQQSPLNAGVYWRDDKVWVQYKPATARLILEAYNNAEKTVKTGPLRSTVHPTGSHYTVDLRTLTQTNDSSGMKRPVKIIQEENASDFLGKSEKVVYPGDANKQARISSPSGWLGRLAFWVSKKEIGFVQETGFVRAVMFDNVVIDILQKSGKMGFQGVFYADSRKPVPGDAPKKEWNFLGYSYRVFGLKRQLRLK